MTSPQRRRIVLFDRSDSQDTVAVTDVLRQETVGGVLMLVAATAAVLWASIDVDGYHGVQHFMLGPLSLQHWAADGLLTLFFLLAGMELKREFVAGTLRRPSAALIPIMAAVGGMLVPAGIYLALNTTLPGGHPSGWAIPMATDIAFALAVVAVFGRGLPASLRAFLLTLAIVDDLGAIVVIAVVFTASLNFLWLALALALAGLWAVLQWRRVRSGWWYVPIFLACWWAMHESGVHATIAGVLLGLLTRTEPNEADDPIDRWEHRLRPWSAGFAVPAFALLSAGVAISLPGLAQVFSQPIGLGVVIGLVAGKTIGVSLGTFLTARFTRAQLAPDLRWIDVIAASSVAGVGFTVALLIAGLAFVDPAAAETAKAGVLVGSVLAAVLAAGMLRLSRRSRVH